jgi:hypothetical protein
MSDEPRQPSEIGTPDPAEKGEQPKARTYTQEEMDIKLRGSGKQINAFREQLDGLTAELAAVKAAREVAEGQAKEAKAAIDSARAEAEKARAEANRQKAFVKIADRLDPAVEVDWIVAAAPKALELGEDGKPTKDAEAALDAFLKSKPTLARKPAGGGMPRPGGGAGGGAALGKAAQEIMGAWGVK